MLDYRSCILGELRFLGDHKHKHREHLVVIEISKTHICAVTCNIRGRVNESCKYLRRTSGYGRSQPCQHQISLSNHPVLCWRRRRKAVLRYIPNIELSVEERVGGMLSETPLAETVDVSGSSGSISSEAASQKYVFQHVTLLLVV
jgi:hypothetical protein